MTSLRVGAATDVGRRRHNNEDSMLVADRLFVVADGMGGHVGGEVASQIAVAAMGEAFTAGGTVDDLVAAVRTANQAILARADADPSLRNMGTTATATALVDSAEGEVLAVAHVGDSRAYLFRDGHLSQITDDHSVPQELLRAGQLTEAEAAVDPRRNQITRVLGLGDPDPDLQTVVPYVGDRLLLCSDGLTNEVSDAIIAEVLATVADAQEAADRLVAMANDNGGGDNITVILVDVVDDDERAERASESLAAMGGLDREAPHRLLSADERNARLRDLARDDRTDDPWTDAPATAGAAGTVRSLEPSEVDVPARRITARVVVFVLALALVLGGAAAAVGWYARGAYFVGVDRGRVTIFQGRPGGLLWFDPTVAERTDIAESQLRPADVPDLERGKEEPSLGAARDYVRLLRERVAGGDVGASGAGDRGSPEATTTTAAS